MSLSSRVQIVDGVPQIEQVVIRKIGGHRGRVQTAKTLANNKRGHPFSISWDTDLNGAMVTFGTNGTFFDPVNFLDFQRIRNAANPLRQWNILHGHKVRA